MLRVVGGVDSRGLYRAASRKSMLLCDLQGAEAKSLGPLCAACVQFFFIGDLCVSVSGELFSSCAAFSCCSAGPPDPSAQAGQAFGCHSVASRETQPAALANCAALCSSCAVYAAEHLRHAARLWGKRWRWCRIVSVDGAIRGEWVSEILEQDGMDVF